MVPFRVRFDISGDTNGLASAEESGVAGQGLILDIKRGNGWNGAKSDIPKLAWSGGRLPWGKLGGPRTEGESLQPRFEVPLRCNQNRCMCTARIERSIAPCPLESARTRARTTIEEEEPTRRETRDARRAASSAGIERIKEAYCAIDRGRRRPRGFISARSRGFFTRTLENPSRDSSRAARMKGTQRAVNSPRCAVSIVRSNKACAFPALAKGINNAAGPRGGRLAEDAERRTTTGRAAPFMG